MRQLTTERTLCSLLIAGKTGVGKSVLLNAMFGETLAKTGVGRPVTADIVRYDMFPKHPLTIFDTPGLRTFRESNAEIQQRVEALIEHFDRQNSSERIQVVWYCINARGKRIEQSEITWIEELAKKNISIILVLTQFFKGADDDFMQYLQNLNLPVRGIVPVLAAALEIDQNLVLPTYGLDQLVKATIEVLPEAAQPVFVQAQLAIEQPIHR